MSTARGETAGMRPARWRAAPGADGARPPIVRELCLLITLYAGYFGGRLIASRHSENAYDHARGVWSTERWLHLPSERSLQQLFLRWPDVIDLANAYYKYVHFPLTAGILVWLFWRHPARCVWTRNVLATLTGSGLVLHLLFPLAPPRLASFGVVDTGRVFGDSVYGPVGHGIADQFAAMPSLHAGWATLVAIAIIRTLHTRWRWLAVLHPVTTILVIVVTGNHYWLDSVVALTLLALSVGFWARVSAVAQHRHARHPDPVTA